MDLRYPIGRVAPSSLFVPEVTASQVEGLRELPGAVRAASEPLGERMGW